MRFAASPGRMTTFVDKRVSPRNTKQAFRSFKNYIPMKLKPRKPRRTHSRNSDKPYSAPNYWVRSHVGNHYLEAVSSSSSLYESHRIPLFPIYDVLDIRSLRNSLPRCPVPINEYRTNFCFGTCHSDRLRHHIYWSCFCSFWECDVERRSNHDR